MIVLFEIGKIFESEIDTWLNFIRMRKIYVSGIWEEYSIDADTGFGIRKVVFPDGQQFTNEVYDYDRRWNAIGKKAYAKKNKSIPYLLELNKMEEYTYVTEDGLFNVIDLGDRYKYNILSSSESSESSESSDSD